MCFRGRLLGARSRTGLLIGVVASCLFSNEASLRAIGGQSKINIVPNLTVSGSLFDACHNMNSWPKVRSQTASLGSNDGLLNGYGSNTDLASCFSGMNSHGISLTLETGVTGAFTTGEAAFAANSVHWDRFIGLGANISALRIDDPWSNGVASQSLSYGTIVQEVSDWIELVRDNYPGIQIVLLEAFPTHSAGQIADFIDDLNSEASSRSVAGLDAFEIDWDINEGGSWSDVEWLYDEIRNRYMDFNVIYWGSGAASSDCDFLERTMDLAYGFASRGMVPDTYTIESWNAYPSDTLPEPAVPSYDCTMMALAAHVIFSAYYPVYDTFGYSVSLRTSDNTHYVVAENDGGDVVNADRTSIGAWETFKLLDLNGGSLNGGDPVALVTGGAWNFRAENNGAMLADEGVVPVEREIFTLLNLDSPGNSIGDGTKVALQSYDGYYACAEYGGGDTVNVNRTSIGSWEEFTLIIH